MSEEGLLPEVEIWTDGSALKAPEGKFFCGAGIVLVYGDVVKEVSLPLGFATVNIAELTAPIEGLKLLKKKCKVKIMTDSQYTIDTQKKWYTNWVKRGWKTQSGGEVKNKRLIQLLKELSSKHDVTWVKVKGHSNLPMNDLADELACKASLMEKELYNGQS